MRSLPHRPVAALPGERVIDLDAIRLDGERPPRSLSEALLGRRWLILGFTAMVVAVVAAWTLTARPVYEASTVVQIDPERPRVVSFGEITPREEPYNERVIDAYYQTQLELIGSRTLLERVIETLKLGQHPAFQPGTGRRARLQAVASAVVPGWAPEKKEGSGVNDLLEELDEHVPVIMLTGHGTIESVVRAMKLGAFDYLIKPVHLEEVRVVIDKGLEARRLAAEVQTLRAVMRERASPDDLVGASPAMEELRQFIARVAPYDVSILVRGESGTGKELVAHAIHAQSKRRRGPFIPLDCAALPETLVESELFGHERGAFTGATQRRLGRFELAHTGTLFLDEIGNLPLSTQMKLLRVLEDRAITRLGGRGQIPIDVRIVAATHVSFEDAIREGRFREDLYHRLNEFTIHVPPLRDRPADIPALVEHFAQRIGEELGKPVPGVTSDAVAALKAYPWPGNVRELRNALKRAAVLAEGAIGLADLPAEQRGRGLVPAAAPAPAAVGATLKDVVRHAVETTERDLILRTLERTRWNRAQAARILGINYKTLYNKLRDYGLLRGDEPEPEAEPAPQG